MEQLFNLYRILIGVSAAALLFGIIVISRRFSNLRNSQKHLYFLAFVNLASMVVFLFGLRELYHTRWKELILFIETIVLSLNLIMAFFIQQSISNAQVPFDKQIKQLFLLSFISLCLYFSLYFIFEGEGSLLNRESEAFLWIYGLCILLAVFGSIIPAVKAVSNYRHNDYLEEKNVSLLVILNAANNLIGLVFFILEFPEKTIGVVFNMTSNLAFGYFLAYYLLTEFFRNKPKPEDKQVNIKETVRADEVYSWANLSKQLGYWNETKAYLSKFQPEMVDEVDHAPLSDLEKVHYILKKLNIKTKEVAGIMNVSARAVEMQRYRIKKKLDQSTEKVE